MSSFFSSRRNKFSGSSGLTRQNSDGYAPDISQQQHQPQQPQPASNFTPPLQRSPSSTRRRLSKKLRIVSPIGSKTTSPTPDARYTKSPTQLSPAAARGAEGLSLRAISTSPFAMNFGSVGDGPAQLGQAHAQSNPHPLNHQQRHHHQQQQQQQQHQQQQQQQQQQRVFPLLSSSPKNSISAAPGAPIVPAATSPPTNQGDSVDEYFARRSQVLADEAAKAFDHLCRKNATRAEQLADKVIQRLKAHDKAVVFDEAGVRRGYGNQKHKRFPGDHFLSNEPLIAQTQLFRVARHAPKGSHLHIHFNACLKPQVLLNLARDMDRMFITSDLPLVLTEDGDGTQNFFLCEIQFSILSREKEKPGDLFSASYQTRQTMQFREFLARFPSEAVGQEPMDWLVSKLVFGEEETYDVLQTSWGAWERFNGRTRMMKGLFNYVSVYRKYTELFLQDLLDDNIQYAEIRPNFMMTNQLWNDDGTAQLDNVGIVELIIDAVEDFKRRHHERHFDGIKIIYCTPRSFSRELVRGALIECLAFKKRWPQYIAGFDLVGEEAMGKPLKTFVPEFLEFQQACQREGLEIPFLFHCGETLDIGTDVDGNLVDALLLGAKRIGHGFALPRHPHVMQAMKARGVCVEVCPISNEVLGLTPRVGGHAVYALLANGVPCTVNSDNGTLFRSSLSHDFYQVMVGKADMTLFGWRQLAEWSLQHACLADDERAVARRQWLAAWSDFVVWLLQTYDEGNPETSALLRRIRDGAEPAATMLSKL